MKLDPNGLHARDCDCSACEVGMRPTETARACADRAMRQGEIARGRAGRALARRQEAEASHRRRVAETDAQVVALEHYRPPTREEWLDLDRVKREMFAKGGHRR